MYTRTESDGRYDLHYQIQDIELDSLVKMASIQFNQFTQDGNLHALKMAIESMNTAITQCQTPAMSGDSYDLAYCYRRYASIIIRDNSIENRYLLAQQALEKALLTYTKLSDHDEVQLLEKQRALHQMRKVAYELKNGQLLQQVIEALRPLAEANPSTNYIEDCNESLFHLHFAFGRFDEALAMIQEAKNCPPKNYGTVLRHEVKTHLAILQTDAITDKKSYFEQNVENNFWCIYDECKKALASFPGSEKLNKRMMKDLILLFSIRAQRSLLGINRGKRPLEYVLNQAREIFGTTSNRYYQQLSKTLRMKIESIKNTNLLPLDYPFFEEVSPPGIRINDTAIEMMSAPIAAEKSPQFFPSQETLFEASLERSCHNMNVFI